MRYSKLFATILLLFIAMPLIVGQNSRRQLLKNAPQFMLDDMQNKRHPKAQYVSQGLFDHAAPYYEVYSSAHNRFAGTKEGDLYIRNEHSKEYSIRLKPEPGWYWHIGNAMWSPDGNYLIARQVNDAGVPTIKLTHNSTTEPTYKTYSRAGEKIPTHQYYIIDLRTEKKVPVQHAVNFPYRHVMDWHADNKNVFLVEADRLMKEITLRNVNIATGESTVLLQEQADTYLIGLHLLQGNSRRLNDMDLVTFLHDREQFIWLSERSGLRQLYLYDYDGNLLRTLTDGIFEEIVAIDTEQDWLYYTTHADPEHPYELQVHRTALTTTKIETLSDMTGIQSAFLSQKKDSVYVLRSGLPALMQMEAYTTSGKHLGTTWKGDVSGIVDGYFNVEYPRVMAADNTTLLASLILKPAEFNPAEKYPIVEYIYGGNFTNEVIRDLFSAHLWQMQTLANSGVIVVFVDGRGTPKRGKEFHDYSYGRFGQVEIEDHVAAIKQIARDRPYMDMEKIGILGHSWGGHFALRALLEAPDFYKVGHINAPAIDPIDFRVAIEPFMGCLPQDCPEKYERSNISNKLANLKAPLMIIHGTADDDVPIEESYKLVAKLKEMDYTNYEFTEYPGMNHIVRRHPFWLPTMINFFRTEFEKM